MLRIGLFRRQKRLVTLLVVALAATWCLLLLMFAATDIEKQRPAATESSESPPPPSATQPVDGRRRSSDVNAANYRVPKPCGPNCPGENGVAVNVMSVESPEYKAMFAKEFFNLFASDKISLWRSVPDARNEQCKQVQYPTDLPTFSVVFIFKNERWSPLLRSVYSVINRSPRHLLKEVILVDDQSENEDVHGALDEYCAEHFGSMVVIYRAPRRLGLIEGKNYGAQRATGQVVVFLDAHIEANEGWAEPLLARIKEKRTAVLCPTIDTISELNMMYTVAVAGYGIFTWSLFFNWGGIPQRVLDAQKKRTDPYPSPTMAGGLLAVDKAYFFELGGYDEGMEVWGGENLELSFKTWMCGGSLEFVPCSHVGHIFRPGHPYNMTGAHGKGDVFGRNTIRLAETWLDDYKRLYYRHNLMHAKVDYGDISSRLELRRKLGCHDFKWFLENVYPEKFIPDEDVFAYGSLRNNDSASNTAYCLDTLGANEEQPVRVAVYPCQGASMSQTFALSLERELRHEDSCAGGSGTVGSDLTISACDARGAPSPQKQWRHDRAAQSLRHVPSDLCVDMTGATTHGQFVKLQKCDTSIVGQRWSFAVYKAEPLPPP